VLLSLLRIVLVGYALACVALWLLQSRMIWIPGGPPSTTPGSLRWRDVELRAKDGVRLHAWLIEAEQPLGIVLHCHGNAGSVEHRIEPARELARLGWSTLLFDYRGYGRSEGSPSEEGTYLDAEAAWEAATGALGFAPRKVVAWGESLGGAVALELARRREIGAVVTEAAFTSLADAAAVHFRWVPVRWLLRVEYDSLGKAPGTSVPWLLLHSPDDEIVPFVHAERLLTAANAARAASGATPAELVRTGAGHNDGGFVLSAAAIAALRSFLDRVAAASP
jgi:fermentation-respiration switch protein FrsA (DUF1100 family)